MIEGPEDLGSRSYQSRVPGFVKVLYFLLLLYLFFASIELMSEAFKLAGRGFAEKLAGTAADPLAGLIIGFLATSLIQSSSTTTTIVVGLVASGTVGIGVAVLTIETSHGMYKDAVAAPHVQGKAVDDLYHRGGRPPSTCGSSSG